MNACRPTLITAVLALLILFGLGCATNHHPLRMTIDPADGALRVTDLRNGQQWRQRWIGSEAQSRQSVVEQKKNQWVLSCGFPGVTRAGKPGVARFEVTIDIAGDDLHFSMTNQSTGQWRAVEYPYVFEPPSTATHPQIIYPHGEGMLTPAQLTDPDFIQLADSDEEGIYSGLGAYMACLGVVDDLRGAGMLAIWETPELAGYRWARVDGLSLPVLHIGNDKYHIDRPQKFIFHFSDHGGYVALAGRYREYIQQIGRHVTLAQKHSPVGGASVFWLHDSIPNLSEMVREMAADGIGPAIINIQHPGIVKGEPPSGLADLCREISSCGFLASRYDQYRDCFAPNPADGGYEQINRDAWPDAVVRKEDGSMLSGFGANSGVINPEIGLVMAKSHIPADLRDHPYTARFMDCYGSIGFGEGVDWSPAHPCDVYRTRWARQKTLQAVRSLGLAVGTECGNDYLLPWLDWVEGPMTLVRWSGLPVGDGLKTPGKDYAISISPRYRIPFYSLVHHDEAMITWRWEDGLGAVPEYDRDKELWCALYGNPPMYFLSKPTWTAQRADIARRQRELSPWLRKVAGKQMISHRFLTPDHLVQQTIFEGNQSVIVNFTGQPFTLQNGTTLSPKSWIEQPLP